MNKKIYILDKPTYVGKGSSFERSGTTEFTTYTFENKDNFLFNTVELLPTLFERCDWKTIDELYVIGKNFFTEDEDELKDFFHLLMK